MTDQTAGKNRPFHWKEKLLLVCALLMGLLLIFLIPPFDSPDELTHFQNVWAIGHGQAFTEEYYKNPTVNVLLHFNIDGVIVNKI